MHKETGMKNLVLAGGVALNCVANGRVLREGPFDDIWIQPAAGDAGGALGAALYAWYQYLGKERDNKKGNDWQKTTYLGPEFSDEEIQTYLESENIPFRKIAKDEIAEFVADLIASEHVVGWFQGRMEFGPRALGNRSIIGDARSSQMQSVMNLKIKFRESFRPFAPSVMLEHVSNYFEIDRSSPYMLLVAPIKEELCKKSPDNDQRGLDKLKVIRSDIPAITHVDYSARIQTVDKDSNPGYHALLNSFYKKTGCPLVINTSFNVRGEPIICTPQDAYLCFMRTNMDYLVLGNFILDKKQQKELEHDIEWEKEFELD